MSSASNGHAEYKVALVGSVNPDLKRFHQQLMNLGKGGEFLEALRKIHDRLRHDPHGFGETLYPLPALHLLVHQGVIIPLAVTYPDLPGCVATGQTKEEVEQMIRAAIELHLEGMEEDGLPIPEPTSRVDYVEVNCG